MANIICKKCGKEIDDEFKLCPFCGEIINPDENKVEEKEVVVGETVEEAVEETQDKKDDQHSEQNSEQTLDVVNSDAIIPDDTSIAPNVKKGRKKFIIIATAIIIGVVLIISSVVLYKKVIKPARDYKAAKMLMDDGKYEESKKIFTKLGDYKDSDVQIAVCECMIGVDYYNKKDYKKAVEIFVKHYDSAESKKYVYKCLLDIIGKDYYFDYLDAALNYDDFIKLELRSMVDFVRDAKLGLNKTDKWNSNYSDYRNDLMKDQEKLTNKRDWLGRVFSPSIIKECNDQTLSDTYDAFVDFHKEAIDFFSNADEYIDDFREANYENINADAKSVNSKGQKYLEAIDKASEISGDNYDYSSDVDLNVYHDFKDEEDEFVTEVFGSEDNKKKWAEDKDSKDGSKEGSTETTDEASGKSNDSKEESYYENDTFEVTYKTLYNNILNDSTIIHKVYASKTKDVEATVIAYDLNGNVIGKATDEIELVEGQYNYFRYHFSTDVSNATFEVKVQIKEPSYLRGEEDAVELVTSSDDGFHLFLTFKQVKPTFGEFAKFKILYIKDGQVIGDADGYYSVYAENLAGKDTTDVAKLLMDVDSYDHIEYFFEP